MNKKVLIGVGVAAVVLLGVFFWARQARDPDDITVGAILPLSGDGAKYGAAARRAIDLGVSKVNDDGGIDGKRLVVVFEDSKGAGKDGVSAIQKLITVNRVPAVIGDLLSSVTLAMAPVAERHRVVLLSPTSSAPKITSAGDYIFRNCASDVFEGKIMAEAAVQQLNIRKVAVLYINNDYGVGITDVFRPTFTAQGGSIVAQEAFAQGVTDFRTQLTKIAATKPDAVYIVGYKELGLLLRQARELGIKAQFLSTVMFEDPEILAVAGNAAEGVIYSARAYDPNSDEPHVKEFVGAFKQRYGEEPDIFAAYAYDAIRILVLAIKTGGTSADKIKHALYSIRDFVGVTGSTSFDANGDVIQPAYLKIVRDGKFMRYN